MVPPSNSQDQERLPWFRNLAPLEPFDNDGQHTSLDFSLQLAVGIDNQKRFTAHPFLRFFHLYSPSASGISR
jgi:hypothetical protein